MNVDTVKYLDQKNKNKEDKKPRKIDFEMNTITIKQHQNQEINEETTQQDILNERDEIENFYLEQMAAEIDQRLNWINYRKKFLHMKIALREIELYLSRMTLENRMNRMRQKKDKKRKVCSKKFKQIRFGKKIKSKRSRKSVNYFN